MDELIVTVRGRRLMKELKRLRAERGLKVPRAAKQLRIGEATLYRLENGKSRIEASMLLAMLDLYGVASPEREALERLGLDSLRRGWWSPYRDVFSGSYVALETDAAEIRINAFVVPGFFQTEAYARATIATTRPDLAPGEVERRMEARTARQKALFDDRDDPPLIHILLDESVIRRQVGGADSMREQLARLAEIASWPTVTIQIVPFSAGAHAGSEGEFVLIDFPDSEDDPFVYEEGLFGDLYLESQEEIARYRTAFDHAATDAALAPDDSRTLLNELAEENT